jgi:hypothetical protein
MTSPALTLIIEDEVKKLVHGDRLFKHKEKLAGLIPRGVDSPFGDFPMNGNETRKTHSCDLIIQPRHVRSRGNGIPPADSRIYTRAPIKATDFRKYYVRGDLPIQIQHGAANKIGWKCELSSLDYNHFLPIFLEGIREKEDPYRFLAVQGTYDILSAITEDKLLPVIPKTVLPLKHALATRDRDVIATVCKIIQTMLVVKEGSRIIGQAFVPFYRNLLPVLGIFKAANHDLGDSFDYAQRKRLCIGDLIDETLQLFEEYGGDEALFNIKYMIPTYESVRGQA